MAAAVPHKAPTKYKASWKRSKSATADLLNDYVSGHEADGLKEALLHANEQCEQGSRPTDMRERYHWTRFNVNMLFEEPRSSKAALVISATTIALVLMSLISFVLESLVSQSPDVHPGKAAVFFNVDLFFNTCFSVEYTLRFWSTSVHFWAFVLDPMNIIDVMSVAPFWVTVLNINGGGNGQCLRVFRLVRLFRVFKLARFSVHLRIIVEAFYWASDSLILMSVFLGVGVFVFSTLMWFLERGEWDLELLCFVREDTAQCSPFQSIPQSMYWGVTTMTTVGYGDAVPITSLGQLVTSLAMIFGILVIAMPVSVLSTSFQRCVQSVQAEFELEKIEQEEEQFEQKVKVHGSNDAMFPHQRCEDHEDIIALQSLNLEIRQISNQLTEFMPKIRAILQKNPSAVHPRSCGADMALILCDNVETKVVGELSLLGQILDGHAVEFLGQEQLVESERF